MGISSNACFQNSDTVDVGEVELGMPDNFASKSHWVSIEQIGK